MNIDKNKESAESGNSRQIVAKESVQNKEPTFDESVLQFHARIRDICLDRQLNCAHCWLRIYCYTPPIDYTQKLVQEVINTLNADSVQLSV